MKFLVILSAILGASLAIPTGGYGSYQTAEAPAAAPSYGISAPSYTVAAPSYGSIQAPIAVSAHSSYASSAPASIQVPTVTGTLHHAQDTYGQYKYGYSISDGQQKEENKAGSEDASGRFSYTSPEGQQINLAYTAGAGGFIAVGDHLPKQVELPAELAAAYQAAHVRLQQAHEEARLRGDSETSGSYLQEGKQEEHRAPQHIYSKGYIQSAGNYAVASAPAISVPAPVKASVHYSAVIPSQQYAPAPAAPKVEYAPAAPKVEYAPAAPKVEEPAPYSSSSYQTEIGGPVSVAISAPSAPSMDYAPAAPMVQYAPVVAVPSAQYAPAPAVSSVQYAPAPAVPSVHYAPAISSAQYAPAPAAPSAQYAPVAAQEVHEPAPYSMSSYQTEIGGPTAVAPATPVVAAPVKSGYSSNGY